MCTIINVIHYGPLRDVSSAQPWSQVDRTVCDIQHRDIDERSLIDRPFTQVYINELSICAPRVCVRFLFDDGFATLVVVAALLVAEADGRINSYGFLRDRPIQRR